MEMLTKRGELLKWLKCGLVGKADQEDFHAWSSSSSHKALLSHIPIACNTIPLYIGLDYSAHIWSVGHLMEKNRHILRKIHLSFQDKSTAYIELYSKWKLVRRMTRWWACNDMSMFHNMFALGRCPYHDMSIQSMISHSWLWQDDVLILPPPLLLLAGYLTGLGWAGWEVRRDWTLVEGIGIITITMIFLSMMKSLESDQNDFM